MQIKCGIIRPLDHIKREYMEYRDAVFAIKYQLLSTIETIKALLIR